MYLIVSSGGKYFTFFMLSISNFLQNCVKCVSRLRMRRGGGNLGIVQSQIRELLSTMKNALWTRVQLLLSQEDQFQQEEEDKREWRQESLLNKKSPSSIIHKVAEIFK